ncbi:hypothetical protein ACTFIY_001542 [Dictyostelium cf. discoideum]
MELQSRWINYVFSGLIDLPSEKEMEQGIIKINEIRNAKIKTLFPFGDYVLFSDQLAKQINCLPDFDEMKLNNPELYDMCFNYVSCSSVFRLTGPFPNEKKALNTIKHFSECFNCFSVISCSYMGIDLWTKTYNNDSIFNVAIYSRLLHICNERRIPSSMKYLK